MDELMDEQKKQTRTAPRNAGHQSSGEFHGVNARADFCLVLLHGLAA